jgi:hypothetical protein
LATQHAPKEPDSSNNAEIGLNQCGNFGLVALKRAYDPDNVLRGNQNIDPRG